MCLFMGHEVTIFLFVLLNLVWNYLYIWCRSRGNSWTKQSQDRIITNQGLYNDTICDYSMPTYYVDMDQLRWNWLAVEVSLLSILLTCAISRAPIAVQVACLLIKRLPCNAAEYSNRYGL